MVLFSLIPVFYRFSWKDSTGPSGLQQMLHFFRRRKGLLLILIHVPQGLVAQFFRQRAHRLIDLLQAQIAGRALQRMRALKRLVIVLRFQSLLQGFKVPVLQKLIQAFLIQPFVIDEALHDLRSVHAPRLEAVKPFSHCSNPLSSVFPRLSLRAVPSSPGTSPHRPGRRPLQTSLPPPVRQCRRIS